MDSVADDFTNISRMSALERMPDTQDVIRGAPQPSF